MMLQPRLPCWKTSPCAHENACREALAPDTLHWTARRPRRLPGLRSYCWHCHRQPAAPAPLLGRQEAAVVAGGADPCLGPPPPRCPCPRLLHHWPLHIDTSDRDCLVVGCHAIRLDGFSAKISFSRPQSALVWALAHAVVSCCLPF